MDSIGASHLAARIRAGVSVGTRIELEQDATESGLCAGDRGVVREITLTGVVVQWDQGLRLSIDPNVTRFRPLDAT